MKQFSSFSDILCSVTCLCWLLLYPGCKNVWWTIYITEWISSECYTWNWRKSKQKGQFGHFQCTVWARCSGEVGASHVRHGRGWWDKSCMVTSCPAHPSENSTLKSIVLPKPLKPQGREIVLFAYLSIKALLLCLNFLIQKQEREKTDKLWPLCSC